MELAELITPFREHYVEQFRTFAEEQSGACIQGASEAKFEYGDDSKLFGRLYCTDFVRNDGEVQFIELLPSETLAFDPITVTVGALEVKFESLQWDDVLIRHHAGPLPEEAFADWFQHWLDPDDERYDEDAELCNIIHSMIVGPDKITIDFGTAEPSALSELLELLAGLGLTSVSICGSRAKEEKG